MSKREYTEIEKLNLQKIISTFGDNYRFTSGGNLSYNCPFCEQIRGKPDNDYKCGVDITTTIYHCFKCHSSGIIVKNSYSNSERIVSYLLDYFNEVDNDKQINTSNNNLVEFNNVEYIRKNSVAYEYLQSRKITDEQIIYYNIMNGINDNLGRIMIPNILVSKWTDYYQGRTYLDAIPKYLNPHNVNKGNIVFNLHNQLKNQKRVYIVEGLFSAIRAGKDVISTYGSSISDVQANLISNYKFKEIYCCYDGDEAGIIGNNKLSKKLFNVTNSSIYTIKLPYDKDPADMGEDIFKEYCEKYRKPFINNTMNNILSYFD